MVVVVVEVAPGATDIAAISMAGGTRVCREGPRDDITSRWGFKIYSQFRFRTRNHRVDSVDSMLFDDRG